MPYFTRTLDTGPLTATEKAENGEVVEITYTGEGFSASSVLKDTWWETRYYIGNKEVQKITSSHMPLPDSIRREIIFQATCLGFIEDIGENLNVTTN